uniref:amino acid transporter AVT1I-like n=1 Tax=Erigeron canadensis TaxID=72917 RepID=UPI001CB96E45|nr:amino acid transporter AVT1I-like [Erigeron canadensis]
MESQNQQVSISQHQQPSTTKGTTFLRTCFNAVNTLSGVGILSVPYALSKGGWLCLLLLLSIALLCFYTGILLRRCMDSDARIKSYPDIGQLAFGRKGRVIIMMFMYLELFLAAVEFLIMEGNLLSKLFPKEDIHIFGKKIGGQKGFVLLTALMVFPTTLLRNLGVLAYVSAFGVVSSVVLVLAVFWGGAFDGIGFHETGQLWNWSGLPTSISMFAFCYCGHTVFPTLYNSMKRKSQFPYVLIVCFTLSTISYGTMAIIGYMMFGEHLTSQVTLNLPTEKITSQIAIYTTLVNPIAKYAIIIAPIVTSVEETLAFLESKVTSWVIRICLVIATVVVALVVPYFGYVMAFIGAFLGISLSILIPCLCYWKILIGFKRFSPELMMILVIMLIGTVVAILGTYSAVANIIINEVHHN